MSIDQGLEVAAAVLEQDAQLVKEAMDNATDERAKEALEAIHSYLNDRSEGFLRAARNGSSSSVFNGAMLKKAIA